MALDPYARIFRPDIEPRNELPQWIPMGGEEEQQAPDVSPFVSMLKQRMSKPSAPKVAMPGTGGINPGEPGIPAPQIPEFGKAMAGGLGGGGKSL